MKSLRTIFSKRLVFGLFLLFIPVLAFASPTTGPSLTANGITVNLTPPSGDISVQLISSLLGTGWWEFSSGGAAPTGVGAILSQLFEVLDIGLLAFVSGLLIWQGTSAALATAHEGVPLGKRYHSVWAPIRAPAAFVMLFPLPWAKGLSLLQVILLTAVYWGIGLADDVWSSFAKDIAQKGGVLQAYPNSTSKQVKFFNEVFELVLTDAYLEEHAGLKIAIPAPKWSGSAGSGEWIFAPQTTGSSSTANAYGVTKLGAIEVHCTSNMQATDLPSSGLSGMVQSVSTTADDVGADVSNWLDSTAADVAGGLGFSTVANNLNIMAKADEAQNSSVCMSEVSNVENLISSKGLGAAATAILDQNKSNGKPINYTSLINIAQQWQNYQQNVWDELEQQAGVNFKAQLKDFSSQSADQGWASSAYFFWTLENINAQANQQFKVIYPTVIEPDQNYVAKIAGKFYAPYKKTLDAVISHYEQSSSFVNDITSDEKVAMTGNANGTLLGGAALSGWFGHKLDGLTSSLTSGEPLMNIMNFGYGMIDAGETGFTISAAADTYKAIYYAKKAASIAAGGAAAIGTDVAGGGPEDPVGDVAAGEAGEATDGLVSKAADMMVGSGVTGWLPLLINAGVEALMMVSIFLIIEGIVLAYIFPAIPSMIMIAAIIGWLFLVVEMLVAAPLWAAAHAFAEGEGFASQQAKYGYSAVVGIIMRPLLLTFGFIFFFFIINIGGWFTGSALQVMFSSMGGHDIGPVAFLGFASMAFITLFMVLKMSMKLITHLADRLPQWIGGHSGQGLGESDIAQGAAQSGSGAWKGAAAGAYTGARAMSGIADKSQYKAEAAEGKAEQERNAQQSADLNASRHSDMMQAISSMGNRGRANLSGGEAQAKPEGDGDSPLG